MKYMSLSKTVKSIVMLIVVGIISLLYFNIIKPLSNLPNLENPVYWKNLKIEYDDLMIYEKSEDSIMFSHLNHKKTYLYIRYINNELSIDRAVVFLKATGRDILEISDIVMFSHKAKKIVSYIKDTDIYETTYLITGIRLYISYKGGRELQKDFVYLLDNIEIK